MRLQPTITARFSPTLVALLLCVNLSNVSAQQTPVRSKSQSMLVTVKVERSCAISWVRLGTDRKENDLRLCQRPVSKTDEIAGLALREQIDVSFKLTIVDQQTRLDF
jgi:hypothetical protein